MTKSPSSPNGNKKPPHRAGNLREQQCLWPPTMSQHSPPPPSPSHGSAPTADFRTPCLSSRGSSSGRLASQYFFIPPKRVRNRRQFLSCSLITGSLTIWGVDMSITLNKLLFGTSSIGVSKLIPVTSATALSAAALTSI